MALRTVIPRISQAMFWSAVRVVDVAIRPIHTKIETRPSAYLTVRTHYVHPSAAMDLRTGRWRYGCITVFDLVSTACCPVRPCPRLRANVASRKIKICTIGGTQFFSRAASAPPIRQLPTHMCLTNNFPAVHLACLEEYTACPCELSLVS
jgi:hypothetical protein